MPLYKSMPLPLSETQENATHDRVETLLAVPDEHVSSKKKSAETVLVSPRHPRQFILPLWPTSQAGPKITPLSPGQRLVSTRTDQVTYDSYDQERGLPGLLPPTRTDQTRDDNSAEATEMQ